MLVTWLRPSACTHCAAKGVIIRLTTNYSHHVYCMRMERTRKRFLHGAFNRSEKQPVACRCRVPGIDHRL
jgi:hypothetical protein